MTPPHLYTREEWDAMTDHDRALLMDLRRREVEAARDAHHARARLVESLTVERFTREDPP